MAGWLAANEKPLDLVVEASKRRDDLIPWLVTRVKRSWVLG